MPRFEPSAAQREAMVVALCARLRATGLQQPANVIECDGKTTVCGCCNRTVDAMIDAANTEARIADTEAFGRL